ncbi:MAG: septum formation initiator family protein [Candidatus Omnitrophota bacterium]
MAKKGLIMRLLILAIALAILFFPGFSKYQELKVRNRELEERIRRSEQENRTLREQAKLLKDDPVAIERAAREKMGLVRDGEILYRVVTEK